MLFHHCWTDLPAIDLRSISLEISETAAKCCCQQSCEGFNYLKNKMNLEKYPRYL